MANLNVANVVLCSVNDTEDSPSIVFGTCGPEQRSGTGIYGNAEEINFTILGDTVLTVDEGGIVIPAEYEFDSIILDNVTASTALVADADKKVISSSCTLAELAYVHGVTSAIQTQMDAKAPLSNPNFPGIIQNSSNANPAAQTNAIAIGAVDSSTTSLRTLSLALEQAVEGSPPGDADHAILVVINGVEYKIALTAVV